MASGRGTQSPRPAAASGTPRPRERRGEAPGEGARGGLRAPAAAGTHFPTADGAGGAAERPPSWIFTLHFSLELFFGD